MIDYQTSLSATYFNQIPLEETNFISSAGITPSSSDLNQLGKASANYAAAGAYYLDSGAANVYILNPVSGGGLNMRGVTRYFTGALYRFIASHTNTGASTANINGLGLREIRLPNGANIAPGDLQLGKVALLTDNGTTLVLLNGQVSLTTPWNQGYQYKCYVNSNAGSPDNLVDFSAGKVRDQDNIANITLAADITKDISVAWIAGNNNGGLPSNLTLSPNTTYACFVIQDEDGNVDAGFDTDFSAANLLVTSGYIYYRRRGYLRTDSSSNIIEFFQSGDEFFIKDISRTLTTFTPTGAPQLVSVVGVPEAEVKVDIYGYFTGISTTDEVNAANLYSPSCSTPPGPDRGEGYSHFSEVITLLTVDYSQTAKSTVYKILTNSSGQIYADTATTTGTGNLLFISWTDERND